MLKPDHCFSSVFTIKMKQYVDFLFLNFTINSTYINWKMFFSIGLMLNSKWFQIQRKRFFTLLYSLSKSVFYYGVYYSYNSLVLTLQNWGYIPKFASDLNRKFNDIQNSDRNIQWLLTLYSLHLGISFQQWSLNTLSSQKVSTNYPLEMVLII